MSAADQVVCGRLSLLGHEPATPCAIGAFRTRAAHLAREAGAGEDVLDGVVLAMSEAVTNIVQHAYPGWSTPGTVTVYAAVDGSVIDFVVEDDGRGTGSWSSTGHGWGLQLIAALASDFQVSGREPSGTSVWMRFRFSRGRGARRLR